MKLEVAIWNGKKTKVLAVETFTSSKEVKDFMKEINEVDKDATCVLISVKKGN